MIYNISLEKFMFWLIQWKWKFLTDGHYINWTRIWRNGPWCVWRSIDFRKLWFVEIFLIVQHGGSKDPLSKSYPLLGSWEMLLHYWGEKWRLKGSSFKILSTTRIMRKVTSLLGWSAWDKNKNKIMEIYLMIGVKSPTY